MPNYTVTWEIQVSASTPREAAEVARAFQRHPSAMVGVFDVIDENGEGVRIDLDGDDDMFPCSECGACSVGRCDMANCPK